MIEDQVNQLVTKLKKRLIFSVLHQSPVYQEHWYEPGYGLVFNAKWAMYPYLTVGEFHGVKIGEGLYKCPSRLSFFSLGCQEFHDFADYPDFWVRVYHDRYPDEEPLRTVVDGAGNILAYMTWHWTDKD